MKFNRRLNSQEAIEETLDGTRFIDAARVRAS